VTLGEVSNNDAFLVQSGKAGRTITHMVGVKEEHQLVELDH